MRSLLLIALFAITGMTSNVRGQEPLNVLLITGGCCHDYDYQTKTIQAAFAERQVPVKWTVINEGGKGTQAEIALYDNPEWSAGFDVVIHNECFANTASEA